MRFPRRHRAVRVVRGACALRLLVGAGTGGATGDRNWRLFHAFVPLTSVGGLPLWIGENPNATGNWMPYPAALVGLPELACSRAAGRLATDWMIHHPAGAAHLNVAKFLRAAGGGRFAIRGWRRCGRDSRPA